MAKLQSKQELTESILMPLSATVNYLCLLIKICKMVNEIKDSSDIIMALEVMSALRPQLNSSNVEMILGGMMKRGYHLLGVQEGGKYVAALGYRFTEHLHWGKAVYIDDLSTLAGYRNKGYARILLEQVKKIALDAHCQQIHLDSGLGENRYNAHRLYLNFGFNITSHHFALELK